MAVLAFVNPKGGSGKTTLSFVLAEQFAKDGCNVCIIDTDPNGFHEGWIKGRRADLKKPPFDIVHVVNEDNIVEALDGAAKKYDIVIVDTEGTANLAITRVLSRTHLVIIPMNTSQMDAEQAGRAVRLLQKDSAMFTRKIEFRLVFSRTSAGFQNTTHRALSDELRAGGLPVLSANLNERRAFRDIFSYNMTVEEMITEAVGQVEEASSKNRKTEERQVQAILQGYVKSRENAKSVADELRVILNEMSDGVKG
jgi:chromosome partitioning protein